MKRSIPLSKCKKCGVLLSRDWPYDLCDLHWREKYHAPPGENYFPEDRAAVNAAEPILMQYPPFPPLPLHHVSSSALNA